MVRAVPHLPLGGALAALMTGVFVSGCTSSGGRPQTPQPTATSVASPTESAKPSVSGPVEPSPPARADDPGRRGAKAQVEHLVDTLNFSMLTGDTELLRRSFPKCSGCMAYANLYEDTYEMGGSFEASVWEIERQLVYTSGGRYYVFADIGASAGKYQQTSESEVRRISSRKYKIRVQLKRGRGGWTVTGLSDAS